MSQKSRYISGRFPVNSATTVASDRYTYLNPSDVEPSLGTSANGAVLTSSTTGARTWTTAPTFANANVGAFTVNNVGIFWSANSQAYAPATFANANVSAFLGQFVGNITVQGAVTSDYITANTTINVLGSNGTSGRINLSSANQGGIYWGNGAPYYSDANVSQVINNYSGNVGGYSSLNQPYIQYLSGVSNITIANSVVLGTNATITFSNGAPALFSNVSLNSSLSNYGAAVVKAGNIFGNGVVGGQVTSNTSVIMTTGLFWANGTNYSVSITGAIPQYSNANVAANVANFLPQFGGNIGSGAGSINGSLYGQLMWPVQNNITSVGTLTGLNVNGGATLSGPTTLNGTTTVNGNLVVAAAGEYTNDLYVGGNLYVAGQTTTINANSIVSNDLFLTLGNAAPGKTSANTAGIYIGPTNNNFGYLRYDATAGIAQVGMWDTNLGIQPYWSGNLHLGSPTNYWGNVYATGIVTGSLNTYNSTAYFNTFFSSTINAGSVQAPLIGNIGATLVGTISTGAQTNITSVGTLTGLGVAGWANVQLGVNAANVYAGAIGNASTVLSGSLINVASAYIPQLNTTAANIAGTTTFGGQLYGSGGAPIVFASNPYFSSNLMANSGVASTNSTTGAIVVTGTGGVGVGGNVNAGGGVYATGALSAGGNFSVTGTSSQTGAVTLGSSLTVGGPTTVNSDMTITGNLTVSNLFSQSTQILQVSNPLVYLSGNSYPYTFDIGLYSHFVGGSANAYGHTGMVRNHNDNQWYFFSNLPEPAGGTVNLASSRLVYDSVVAGGLTLQNTTPSTSTTTGALVVQGGAGINGLLNAAGLTASTANITTGYISTINAGTINGATIGNTGAILQGATLNTTGAVTAANLITTNGIFWPNGQPYGQGQFTSFSTANIDQYLPGYQGNISSGNATVNNQLFVRGNAYIIGNLTVGNISYLTSEVVTTTEVIQGNVTAQSNLIAQGTAYLQNGVILSGNLTPTNNGWLGTSAQQFANLYVGNVVSNTQVIAGVAGIGANAIVVGGNASISGNAVISNGVYAGAVYAPGFYWAGNGTNILSSVTSGGGGGGGSGTAGAYYSGIVNFTGSPVTDFGSGETYVFSGGSAYFDPFGQTTSPYTSDWNELETTLSTLDLGSNSGI